MTLTGFMTVFSHVFTIVLLFSKFKIEAKGEEIFKQQTKKETHNHQ